VIGGVGNDTILLGAANDIGIGDNASADRAIHVRRPVKMPAEGFCDSGASSASGISFQMIANCSSIVGSQGQRRHQQVRDILAHGGDKHPSEA